MNIMWGRLACLSSPSPSPCQGFSPAPTSEMDDTEEPLEILRFHPEAKGAQVILDAKRITAYRLATFHDGIVFSQRPVQPGERVALRVLGHESGWHGGLRVGFTRLNPAHVPAPSLPPFVCPDLEQQSPTWAALLPDGCALAGDIVSFWVSRHGRLCAQVNRGRRLLLRRRVPVGAPLWAVMDVYGTTKAIELLSEAICPDQAPPLGGGGRSGDQAASALPTASPWALREETPSDSEATAGEECAICLHCAADTCLVPCGHTHFCSCCAWRVFRDTAKCPVCRCEVEGVVSAWGPPALRTGEGLPVSVAK
ncbi:E3 ubiquitin-protein ligase NEURL3 isoform X2 [Artibeus jamaicensis]|uniref:E3 ubiquitin-protein ligase NEURL3 isoform X2 n=1 Tax=Artibeus jamaicensis TaxID=9417 RepID=UPI00235A58F3|nr:E3 ubiquitin-protein ligase NEURL3 isoform X2 [Artibeus jamaicensis]